MNQTNPDSVINQFSNIFSMENSHLFTEYFFARLVINIVAMLLIVRVIYYNTYKKEDSFFTFFLLNLIVFLLAYMLEQTGSLFSIGSAFGLLAAFTLLRIRTETITMKDMTYLFIVMTLGLINSIMKGTYIEIIALNALIIIAVFIIDSNKIFKIQQHKTIDYPSIEKIKPEQQVELIADLKNYTGLNIRRIVIERIDIGKGKAQIKIFYRE